MIANPITEVKIKGHIGHPASLIIPHIIILSYKKFNVM